MVCCNMRPHGIKCGMKKLLRPKDILLLGLAGALDIFEEVKHPLGISALAAKEVYGWVPPRYQKKNFYRIVERGLKTKEIGKVIKNGEVYLEITASGKERLIRDFPLISMKAKPWNGRWQVVIFDVAEIDKSKRNSLRHKLQTLGFGMLQESVWITPHDFGKDMREFVENLNLAEQVFVLEVTGLLAGDKDRLLNKIFKLDDLQRDYQEIVEEAKTEKDLEKIRQRYLAVRLTDPELPEELLPRNWLAEKARMVCY